MADVRNTYLDSSLDIKISLTVEAIVAANGDRNKIRQIVTGLLAGQQKEAELLAAEAKMKPSVYKHNWQQLGPHPEWKAEEFKSAVRTLCLELFNERKLLPEDIIHPVSAALKSGEATWKKMSPKLGEFLDPYPGLSDAICHQLRVKNKLSAYSNTIVEYYVVIYNQQVILFNADIPGLIASKTAGAGGEAAAKLNDSTAQEDWTRYGRLPDDKAQKLHNAISTLFGELVKESKSLDENIYNHSNNSFKDSPETWTLISSKLGNILDPYPGISLAIHRLILSQQNKAHNIPRGTGIVGDHYGAYRKALTGFNSQLLESRKVAAAPSAPAADPRSMRRV